jgi:hypothetical protein
VDQVAFEASHVDIASLRELTIANPAAEIPERVAIMTQPGELTDSQLGAGHESAATNLSTASSTP